MKRIAIIFSLTLSISAAFCDDHSPFFFYGVGGKLPTWNSESETLNQGMEKDGLMIPMQDQMYIADKLLEGKNQDINVIIGHSQGGMRALGYAGYTNRTADSSLDKVDGLITIGAPNNGLSFLAQGIGSMRHEVFSAVQTVADGLNAAKRIIPDITIDLRWLNLMGIDLFDDLLYWEVYEDHALDAEVYIKSLQLDDSSMIGTFLDEDLDPATTSIAGMMPGSNFIKDNMRKSEVDYIEWRSIKVGLIKIKFPIVHYKSTYYLPQETKYGFIVGTDSDVIELTARMIDVKEILEKWLFNADYVGGIIRFWDKITFWKDGLYDDSRDAIDSTLETYCTLMNIAEPLWKTDEIKNEAAAAAAWTIKWINPTPYNRAKRAADISRDRQRDCRNGKSWIKNYETNYSQLLGTRVHENDCLIPAKDQYVDVTKFGGEFVDFESRGRFEGNGTRFNHIEEMGHEQIWGPNGRLSTDNGYVDGGVLRNWLKVIYEDEALTYTGDTIK